MDEFKASNGVTVKRVSAGLYVKGDQVDLDRLREKLQAGSYGDVTPAMQVALSEFFQAERDEELGRWRWPENPDYVVHPDANDAGLATVMRESVARIRRVRRGGIDTRDDFFEHFNACAEAYFEAHPERKPWEDAKPGEVWLLTIDGREEPALLHRIGEFETPTNTYSTTAHCIKSARRIYPESD